MGEPPLKIYQGGLKSLRKATLGNSRTIVTTPLHTCVIVRGRLLDCGHAHSHTCGSLLGSSRAPIMPGSFLKLSFRSHWLPGLLYHLL